MELGVPESFKVLIKICSRSRSTKVLTDRHEEVEVRGSIDDDLGDRERQEIGFLMGDETGLVSQTAVAAREVIADVAASELGEGEVPVVEEEEEEEEEIDDSKPIDTTLPIPDAPPVRAAGHEGDADIFKVVEESTDDDLDGAQGYELEEEEEEV